MSNEDAARILAVGTCDFDNFGDLLMLLVTEKYLRETTVRLTSAGTFGWPTVGLLGRQLGAYGPLLESERFDAVWSFGGETGVGYQLVEQLFSLTAPDDKYEEFMRAGPAERERIVRTPTGRARIICPHIPVPEAYPLNSRAVTVINSMGLSQLIRAGDVLLQGQVREPLAGWEWEQLISTLRDTTVISVRDQESSELLTALGVEHRLAPDVVHAIGLMHPIADRGRSDTAVFQIKSSLLSKLGVANVGAALLDSRQLQGFRIRVLQAGNLRDDDATESSEELVRHIKNIEPARDIELISERDPLALVEHIARAGIVIGSSHHLRVIASSYNVPRVSLSFLPIRVGYARLWDPAMPYDVSLHRLERAIENALASDGDRELGEHTKLLSNLAVENLDILFDQTMSLIGKKRDRAEAVN